MQRRGWLLAVVLLNLWSREAHAARWTVLTAEGKILREVEVRRFEDAYYLTLDDLATLFDGKLLPAAVRYRYVAPTKTLTLQVRLGDEVLSLRMNEGSSTARLSGGRAFTLKSSLREENEAVWVPLEVLTEVFPSVVGIPFSFAADARRITVGLSSNSVSSSPSEAAVSSVPTGRAPVWSELVVALNAGHGGPDLGARANGLFEKTLTLDVVQRIQRIAEGVGGKTLLVRKGDYALPASSRSAVAREGGANVFVSVHFNAAVQTNRKGYRIYVNYPTPASVAPMRGGRIAAPWAHIEASRKLAKLLDSSLNAVGFEGEPPMELPLAELEQTKMPSVLVELGFLSNPTDAALWMRSETRDRVAEAIWEALSQFQP